MLAHLPRSLNLMDRCPSSSSDPLTPPPHRRGSRALRLLTQRLLGTREGPAGASWGARDAPVLKECQNGQEHQVGSPRKYFGRGALNSCPFHGGGGGGGILVPGLPECVKGREGRTLA